MNQNRAKISIAAVLAIVFGGLVAVSTGTLLAISLSSAVDTIRSGLTARVEALIVDAVHRSEAFFQPMEDRARWLAQEIASGRVRPDDTVAYFGLIKGLMASTRQISAISYQRPDGTGLFYDRASGELKTVSWPQAWQVRLNQNASGPQTWPATNGQWVLRPSVLDGKPVGTFIIPARTEHGHDIGVVAVRMDRLPLARQLATDAKFRGHKLVRFMLFNRRIVIGHPQLQTMEDVVWPSIDDLNDQALKRLNDAPRQPLALIDKIPDVESFAIEIATGQRFVALSAFEDRTVGGDLLIGLHFDPEAGAPEYNRLVNQAAIGATLLATAIIAAIWLGHRAAAPMRRFASAAELVEQEKLDDFSPLTVGSVRELASASQAFNGMVEGLKERRRIRDLFGKYVPQDVATLLVSNDAFGKPRNVEATVLFLDIAGFSSMSERLSPAEVVATMNAFFSDAVGLIEKGGGMVAQFQGDAILAVFNVPVEQENHATAAVKVAVQILDKVDRKRYAGQQLGCRIGINTGTVVAGAIGAEGRLSYTVYGDAVNIAARLESMNKEFGTRILLSRTTSERTRDVAFSSMGTMAVRGREALVEVLTVATTS